MNLSSWKRWEINAEELFFSLLPGKGKKMQNNFVKERGTRNRRSRSEFGNKGLLLMGKKGLGVF